MKKTIDFHKASPQVTSTEEPRPRNPQATPKALQNRRGRSHPSLTIALEKEKTKIKEKKIESGVARKKSVL